MNNTANSPRRCLITGAAKRIGAALCRQFHAEGFDVAIHCQHSRQAADALANALNQQRPNSALVLQADLCDVTAVQAMAAEILALWQGLDVLINNASGFNPGDIGTVSEVDWDKLLGSNLKGPFFLSQALAEGLENRQGCIINIIDIHGEKPLPGYPVYSIAKAGLAMMTQALALELGPSIRVNGIAPGAILWPGDNTPLDHPAEQQRLLQITPLAKRGEADDIAKTALFLACNAPYISGQIIAVDGGRSVNL